MLPRPNNSMECVIHISFVYRWYYLWDFLRGISFTQCIKKNINFLVVKNSKSFHTTTLYISGKDGTLDRFFYKILDRKLWKTLKKCK